jgi:ADP-ribose diphosphatase
LYKLIGSKAVYKSQWMTVYEDSVLDKEKGGTGIFNRIGVDDAAIIVPIFEDRSLLMVENYRHGIAANILELPGGLIKHDGAAGKEQPAHAARRELLEETEYECQVLDYAGSFYTWPGRSTQKNFVFVAKGLEKNGTTKNLANAQLDDFEYIQVYKFTKEEVLQKIKNGCISSAVTLSALFCGYFDII